MATLIDELKKAEAAKAAASKRVRELRARERAAAAKKRDAAALEIGRALVDSVDADRAAFIAAATAFWDARHGAAATDAAPESAPTDAGSGWG